MAEPVIIERYTDKWIDEFNVIGYKIRECMGDIATRIDHIGSTSIIGLDAKPIIDVQISVKSFHPFNQIRKPLEKIGYSYKPDNTELTKRYFREQIGQKRTHIHVRLDGHWSQQFPLLFRDYMRLHPNDCKEYSDLKHKLAIKYRNDRKSYVNGKIDFIWEKMKRADSWAHNTGWVNSESDF
ncbi:GrpB family protein [Vallitalea guaymasensis]|uniref:GrpB family protein n=1 Tax=Vallitalea guaymasensis TaxID=1185412 RepID=UPI000DE25405|nr:GrpB family protein [Vallitalea guaymasensis]